MTLVPIRPTRASLRPIPSLSISAVASWITEVDSKELHRREAWQKQDGEVPLKTLSPEAILLESEQMVSEDLQEELDELLYLNREGELDNAGQERLEQLMETVRQGLVRKAEALKLAVELGLRPPLG